MPKDARPSSSDALFERLLSSSGAGEKARVSSVFTKLIDPNPKQPRKEIDPDAFELLKTSIREKGVQQPLLVRPRGRRYELVAGQRRLLAAQQLDLPEVPVVVHELNDAEALEAAIIENLAREDLNPVDETDSILHLLSLELGIPVGETTALLYRMQRTQRGAHNVMGGEENTVQKEVVKRVFRGLGKMSWVSFVQNRLPILTYTEEVLQAVRSGKLGYTKARELVRVRDDVRQELLEKVLAENSSLADVKKLVAASTADREQVNDASALRLAALKKQLSLKRLGQLEAKKRRKVETLLEQLHKLLSADEL